MKKLITDLFWGPILHLGNVAARYRPLYNFDWRAFAPFSITISFIIGMGFISNFWTTLGRNSVYLCFKCPI